jgi:hypothetical protein
MIWVRSDSFLFKIIAEDRNEAVAYGGRMEWWASCQGPEVHAESPAEVLGRSGSVWALVSSLKNLEVGLWSLRLFSTE